LIIGCGRQDEGKSPAEQKTQRFKTENLHKWLLKGSGDLLERFPDDPFRYVIFFEGDPDSAPLALWTDKSFKDADGHTWQVMRFKDGKWQNEEYDGGAVEALEDEIFVWTKEGQTPKLVVIRLEWRSAQDKEGNRIRLVSRVANRVTMNKKGDTADVKETPIPELGFKEIKYEGPESIPEIKLKSPNDKLEPVQIQKLHPNDRVQERDGKPIEISKEYINAQETMVEQNAFREIKFPESCFKENAPVLTRDEVIRLNPADPDKPGDNRSRLYTKVDLTGNGLLDIIISDDLHTGGTGGLSYSIYLCINTNQYREANVEIGGSRLAIDEADFGHKSLWSYWHISSCEGGIQYIYLDDDGEWKSSPSLTIYTLEGIGSGIYSTIFEKDTLLPMRIISPSSSTNDLPLVDAPW
jgi:hypothetical protein